MCIKEKCIELCRDCEVFLEVKVGIEEDIIGMGSECKKWMIFAFVIAISFSLVMEGALAARHLMQGLTLPNYCFIPTMFGGFDYVICAPPPPLGSATRAP